MGETNERAIFNIWLLFYRGIGAHVRGAEIDRPRRSAWFQETDQNQHRPNQRQW